MRYLLDSDQCIYALSGRQDAVELVDRLLTEGCAITVITYMEIYQGIVRSSDPERAGLQMRQFLQQIPIIVITATIAERCALLRQQLKEQGGRVNARALDLLNAATALTHGLVLVTNNTEDYEDILGLALYGRNQEG